MRTLLLLGLLAAVAVAAGCSSNGTSGNLTGWNDQAALVSGQLTPTPPTIDVVGAVYGVTSNVNLGAGTFTVTTPDGKSVDIVLSATSKVLYKGSTTDVGTSQLTDGLTVTVTGTVIGLPTQAKVRAALVVINVSESNQELLTGGNN